MTESYQLCTEYATTAVCSISIAMPVWYEGHKSLGIVQNCIMGFKSFLKIHKFYANRFLTLSIRNFILFLCTMIGYYHKQFKNII